MALILKKKKPHESEAHDAEHPGTHEESHSAGGHDDESNWLVSYADMMTLLCGFFIMLFSMAKVDEPKFEKLKESVAKEFGAEYVSPSAEMGRYMTQIIQEAGIERDTTVKTDPLGVSVTFQSNVFFDTLSAEVSPAGLEILNKVTAALAERQNTSGKKYKIVVEGHTDGRSVVSGPYPTNWELSAARASRVVRLFRDKDIPPGQLTAIGYADTYPELPERQPDGTLDLEAMKKNRRVVIRLLLPNVDHIPLPTAAPDAEVKTQDQKTVPIPAAPATDATPSAATVTSLPSPNNDTPVPAAAPAASAH